jgi:hypothetical protein
MPPGPSRSTRARGPTLDSHVLVVVVEQGHQLDAGPIGSRDERHSVGLAPHVLSIGGIELPELHEDGAASL